MENNTDGVDVVSMAQQVKQKHGKAYYTPQSDVCVCVEMQSRSQRLKWA